MLAGWFSMAGRAENNAVHAQAGTDESGPAEKADDESAPKDDRPRLVEYLGVGAVLVIPIGFIIVIAHLQRRRRQAYRDAAKQQKDEARAASRTARDLGDLER